MAKYKKRRCYCTSCRGQKKRSRVSIWRHKKSDAEEEKKELDQEIADEIKMEENSSAYGDGGAVGAVGAEEYEDYSDDSADSIFADALLMIADDEGGDLLHQPAVDTPPQRRSMNSKWVATMIHRLRNLVPENYVGVPAYLSAL